MKRLTLLKEEMKQNKYILEKEYTTLTRIEIVKGFKENILNEAMRVSQEEDIIVNVYLVDRTVFMIEESPEPQEHIFVARYEKGKRK